VVEHESKGVVRPEMKFSNAVNGKHQSRSEADHRDWARIPEFERWETRIHRDLKTPQK
jgi:hypothetical protein